MSCSTRRDSSAEGLDQEMVRTLLCLSLSGSFCLHGPLKELAGDCASARVFLGDACFIWKLNMVFQAYEIPPSISQSSPVAPSPYS